MSAEHHASVVLGVEGMVSSLSEGAIESALGKLPGVAAAADFPSRSLKLEFDRRQCVLPEIVRRLDELGYRVRFGGPARVEKAEEFSLWWLARLILHHRKLMTAIVGSALLLIAAWARFFNGPAELRYTCVVLSFIIAGWYTAIDTFQVVRRFRFDIDVLMFAAAFGAASLGNWEEGALLLVLFAFGGAGEELAMDRARQAIAALAKLAPETATRRDAGGRDQLVRVEELAVGDLVVIHPFDRVPADGVVHSGISTVDQSPITGESVPVEKIISSAMYAGTINGDGLLVVSVTKRASETTLAKIIRMVQEAQASKSPTQLFTDRVERVYVPIVLVLTGVLVFVPPLFGGVWREWFYRAMAFLTAASPCALAIGTPAAVLSGIARAARAGVLVKGGVHLENLGRIRVVAFDKTGTLTSGKAQVTDVVSLNSVSSEQLLSLAAAVESSSTHPLARAIVGEARALGLTLPPAMDVQQVPGRGVSALVEGRRVIAGRVEMLGDVSGDGAVLRSEVAKLGEAGRSVVVVAVDQKPIGVIGLADRPRENAALTLRQLKRIGIARTIMLTGDKAVVARSVAEQIGADEYHAELLPEQKVELVRSLEQQYGPLAMVGDGVNDAPALASATVGIAMGGAGTDVAMETADVALMGDDLRKLPEAIGLSRFSRKIIRQNLAIALGVISILAPMAALGYAWLGVAVLFHEGSTVVVVLNAMRLLVYRAPEQEDSSK